MFSFINSGRIALAKFFSAYYSVISLFTAGINTSKELPKTPDDFNPVVRFAVCSDVHLNGDENQEEAKRLRKLIDFMYGYSEKSSYKNFDALVVVGDFTADGSENQYDCFNRIINEKLKNNTKLLTCTGNHEYIKYRDVDASVGTKVFEKKMGHKDDTHVVINGYHFILCSYSEDGYTFNSKLPWLDKVISSAEHNSQNKPIFVFQHPAPFSTVYGSIHWGDISVPKVLNKYNNVIDFSGHSHYPINDPRSIWQGKYTALGCGTLSYFETELDFFAGNNPYQYTKAAEFYIVEADENGNVSVKPYDLITNSFFDNQYYFEDLHNNNFQYTFNKLKRLDKPPKFENPDVHTYINEKGETLLCFNGAKDLFVTESYKLSVYKNFKTVFSDNFSGKYMYIFEKDYYEVNLGILPKGKYTVRIQALNAYAKVSETLKYTFTV